MWRYLMNVEGIAYKFKDNFLDYNLCMEVPCSVKNKVIKFKDIIFEIIIYACKFRALLKTKYGYMMKVQIP